MNREYQNYYQANSLDEDFSEIQKMFAERDFRKRREEFLEREQYRNTQQRRGRRVIEATRRKNKLKTEIIKTALPLLIISGLFFSIAGNAISKDGSSIAEHDSQNRKNPIQQEIIIENDAEPSLSNNIVIEEDDALSNSSENNIILKEATPELKFSEQNISASEASCNIQNILEQEDFNLEGDNCKEKLIYLYQKIGFSKAQTAGLLANNLIENPSLNPFQYQIDSSDPGVGIFMETGINKDGYKGESYSGYKNPAEYDGLLIYVDKNFPDLMEYFSNHNYSFSTHTDNSLKNSTMLINSDRNLEKAIDKALIVEVAYCLNTKYCESSYEHQMIESSINSQDATPSEIASAFCLKVERPYSKNTEEREQLAEKIYQELF